MSAVEGTALRPRLSGFIVHVSTVRPPLGLTVTDVRVDHAFK
jgi:hypothetical protein